MKTIILSGPIGYKNTADGFRSELAKAGPAEAIRLEINSPGGSVFEGREIRRMILNHGGRVTAYITSLAASMASDICTACDHVVAYPDSVYMIHCASGLAAGNSATLKKMSGILDALDQQMAENYAAKTGKPVSKIKKMMEAETWLHGREIVSEGFADELIDTRVKSDRQQAIAAARRQFHPAAWTPGADEIAAIAASISGTTFAPSRTPDPRDSLEYGMIGADERGNMITGDIMPPSGNVELDRLRLLATLANRKAEAEGNIAGKFRPEEISVKSPDALRECNEFHKVLNESLKPGQSPYAVFEV